MGTVAFTPDMIGLISARFKALAEPARLHILQSLRGGERTVTQLVNDTGLAQANLSKHLAHLHSLGFVRRRKEGLFAYYALADTRVARMCDIMCGRLEAETRDRNRIFAV